MQNNNTLAYHAKTLATKAVIFADNLEAQSSKLSPQYQDMLQVATLRAAATKAATAITAYETNYDNKQMLASTTERNLRDTVANLRANRTANKATALSHLIAQREELHNQWRAKCAEIRAEEARLNAAHAAQLSNITVEAKTTVTQNREAAKAFGDELKQAYADLHSVYMEYKNLVEGAALKLKDPSLVSSVLPREAARTVRRASASGAGVAEASAGVTSDVNSSVESVVSGGVVAEATPTV